MKYVAIDGTKFDIQEECENYEKRLKVSWIDVVGEIAAKYEQVYEEYLIAFKTLDEKENELKELQQRLENTYSYLKGSEHPKREVNNLLIDYRRSAKEKVKEQINL